MIVDQLPITFTDPSPHRLVRRGDSGGSLEAAIALVESGKLEMQTAFVGFLVAALPGRTSAELTEETKQIGARLGFSKDGWRHLLGRRLSDAEGEGAGPIIGSIHAFSRSKPWRIVDPNQPKCRASNADPEKRHHAIRWWPTVAANRSRGVT